MNKRKIQPPIVGGSSLLVIFAVLCLTVFALLGFSTVQEMRLSDASAEAVAEYYEAELQAETILCEIRSGNIPEGVNAAGDRYAWTCRISDTQELQAEIRFDGKDWEILRWQAVSTADWEEENTLSVLNGN